MNRLRCDIQALKVKSSLRRTINFTTGIQQHTALQTTNLLNSLIETRALHFHFLTQLMYAFNRLGVICTDVLVALILFLE
jgi:hypothetical protein